MTLIISEISNLGIVMVADSAITFPETLPSGKKVHYTLHKANKLQYIQRLNAGISMWGLGRIQIARDQALFTDTWIQYFIDTHKHLKSIDDFAHELAEELQRCVGFIDQPLGFHLAGYSKLQKQRLPTLYHIRNCDGNATDGYQLHEFIPGLDYPPEVTDDFHILRNGDYAFYAILKNFEDFAREIFRRNTDISIPSPTLEGRLIYHKAWVRFVSELHRSAGQEHIGGALATLAIPPKGKHRYSAPE